MEDGGFGIHTPYSKRMWLIEMFSFPLFHFSPELNHVHGGKISVK